MNPVLLFGLPVIAFVISYATTARFRRYVVASGRFVDVPNERSSHVVPTPRGGGIAIVTATLAVLPVLGWTHVWSWPAVWAFAGAGVLVALIGAWDDVANLSRTLRLVGHFVAAVWAVSLLDTASVALAVRETWIGFAAAAFFMVWFLNLTNFMDGIDGILGVQILTVCGGGALLYLLVPAPTAYWAGPLILAGAALGFLFWNWPPAKIFMGDTGSGFIGITVAAFALQAGSVDPALFWSWLILYAVFVTDATVTLLRRMLRGDPFHQAHRSHAYQHAALVYGGHKPVVLTVAAINVLCLFPLAAAVAVGLLPGLPAVLVSYAVLTALVLWQRGGGIDDRKRRSSLDA